MTIKFNGGQCYGTGQKVPSHIPVRNLPDCALPTGNTGKPRRKQAYFAKSPVNTAMSYHHHFEQLKSLYGLAQTSGFVATYMDNVRFFWSTEHVPRAPLPYTKGIILLGQGHKVGYLDDRVFQYDQDNYLIASIPTSYECETFASEDQPVLGILIDIDVPKLNQLLEKVEKYQGKQSCDSNDIYCGLAPIKMDPAMKEATNKLLSCLQSPLDSEVLGQSAVDEIIFRALLGKHGKALMALTRQDSQYARIAHSLSHIHENYMNPISVDHLADKANMSLSSFHRAFKQVTGESPLRYLKKVQLNKARSLITAQGLRVNIAANQVGYESVSQFSREFKRYFNVSPSQAHSAAYANMYK